MAGRASFAQETADAVAPEGASDGQVQGLTDEVIAALEAKMAGQPVTSQNWMVAAANPLAVEAGAKVLRAGGSAADAMVAVQVVLGLVEPQSSGLGGGAFLVWYDAATGNLTTLDGRETAPLEANHRLFHDENGEPLKFYDAVVGGLSVGTPGTPALLEEAHRRWGRSPWPSLFQDGITLADEGFLVSPRLATWSKPMPRGLSRFPVTAEYFLPGGTPLQQGQRLMNPDYAKRCGFWPAKGRPGSTAVKSPPGSSAPCAMRPGNPGVLSGVDLALYQVIEREPVCAAYRIYEVCGMGPPSSGALTVGQILGMLDGYDLAAMGPEDAMHGV